MSYTPDLVFAQVLYDNVFRMAGATVSYDGTVVAGFEPANAYDWRDFSLFQPAASTHLMVEFGSAVAADTGCVWWADIASSGTPQTATLQYWDGAAWQTAAAMTQPSYGAPQIAQWKDFTAPSATKYRFTFSGSNAVRQVCVGPRLQFPMGQWQGIAPPNLQHGVVMENLISVNGSILGRNLRRVVKEGQINLSLLTQAWVRDSWNPFAVHASRYAFFWRWNPVSYPNEVGFCVADKIDAPKNGHPPGYMDATLPMLYLG